MHLNYLQIRILSTHSPNCKTPIRGFWKPSPNGPWDAPILLPIAPSIDPTFTT